NAASLLLFVLLAYFVAILLKGIWEFLAARGTRKVAAGQADGREVGDDRPLSDDILTIRERIPSGASRLLKLQAEKNMCEVLLAGVPILFLGDAFGMVVGVRGGVTVRASLALVLLLSWVVCWRWRRNLESLYQHDLSVLVTWARKNGPSGRC
ncbi:MAG TPA: hypothetical protein VFT97_05625, partial [Candidatus Eisenbacteria bacterium]|nr:hypothetical protein [Candidatus Eisenbacteria bacterium]